MSGPAPLLISALARRLTPPFRQQTCLLWPAECLKRTEPAPKRGQISQWTDAKSLLLLGSGELWGHRARLPAPRPAAPGRGVCSAPFASVPSAPYCPPTLAHLPISCICLALAGLGVRELVLDGPRWLPCPSQRRGPETPAPPPGAPPRKPRTEPGGL